MAVNFGIGATFGNNRCTDSQPTTGLWADTDGECTKSLGAPLSKPQPLPTTRPRAKGTKMDDLGSLLGNVSLGAQTMYELLVNENVTEITINAYNKMFYTENGRRKGSNRAIFRNLDEYIAWIDTVLQDHTDAKYASLREAEGKIDVIEASLKGGALYGSIHVVMPEITRDNPIVTVRKQPRVHITLDQMLHDQNMMDPAMRVFLEMAMRGRLNILVSGGSGAGKTTMVRALAQFIDPNDRVITCEEIDELHLQAPNVVPMFTHVARDEQGRELRRVELNDLVRHTLRMRPERIWVGEVRGAEAHSLVKACNTGHDGSLTTVHADTARTALKNLITYVMEAGVTEDVAREAIARAFDLIVHIKKVSYERRVVFEIAEVSSAIEGNEIRMSTLFEYDYETDGFIMRDNPSPELERKLAQYGVNIRDEFNKLFFGSSY